MVRYAVVVLFMLTLLMSVPLTSRAQEASPIPTGRSDRNPRLAERRHHDGDLGEDPVAGRRHPAVAGHRRCLAGDPRPGTGARVRDRGVPAQHRGRRGPQRRS